MANQQNNSNELVRFVNVATTSLHEAMNRQTNGKKVNIRKYIQKRLQNGTKTTRKSKTTPQTVASKLLQHANAALAVTASCTPSSTMVGRQPVATVPPHYNTPSSSFFTNTYDTSLYNLITPTTGASTVDRLSSYGYSRPSSSCNDAISDPEIESLLSDFGLDSPPSYSDYNRRGSNMSSNSTWDPYAFHHSNEFMIPSPPSDFSDFEHSNYSSPRNVSPVCYPTSISPPMYHQQLTMASCEWVPPPVTTSTSLYNGHPNYLNLNPTIPQSLNEILELVTP